MARYPLSWPEHISRSSKRDKGTFKTSLAQALENVETSLKRFAADSGKPIANLIISSNVTLGHSKPEDPGVAIWFTWDGLPVCIPIDRYTTVEANLQAIHHVIEARRTELRHGTLALVRATFMGFKALPAPEGDQPRPWWDVLNVPRDASKEQIFAAYHELAKTAHPDRGGSNETMAELTRARDEALREMADR